MSTPQAGLRRSARLAKSPLANISNSASPFPQDLKTPRTARGTARKTKDAFEESQTACDHDDVQQPSADASGGVLPGMGAPNGDGVCPDAGASATPGCPGSAAAAPDAGSDRVPAPASASSPAAPAPAGPVDDGCAEREGSVPALTGNADAMAVEGPVTEAPAAIPEAPTSTIEASPARVHSELASQGNVETWTPINVELDFTDSAATPSTEAAAAAPAGTQDAAPELAPCNGAQRTAPGTPHAVVDSVQPRTPNTVIQAMSRLCLTTPGGTPLPAIASATPAPTATARTPANETDFSFAPNLDTSLADVSPCPAGFIVGISSPDHAADEAMAASGPEHTSPTRESPCSLAPPANTPMAGQAARTTSLDAHLLQSVLDSVTFGVPPNSPAPTEAPARRMASAIVVPSPLSDGQGQVRVSPSLNELRRQVRAALLKRSKEAEVGSDNDDTDGASGEPGTKSEARGRDDDFYVHLASADEAEGDLDEAVEAEVGAIVDAMGGLKIAEAAFDGSYVLQGLPAFRGTHVRFGEGFEVAQGAGGAKLRLRGLPTPVGKHTKFDD